MAEGVLCVLIWGSRQKVLMARKRNVCWWDKHAGSQWDAKAKKGAGGKHNAMGENPKARQEQQAATESELGSGNEGRRTSCEGRQCAWEVKRMLGTRRWQQMLNTRNACMHKGTGLEGSKHDQGKCVLVSSTHASSQGKQVGGSMDEAGLALCLVKLVGTWHWGMPYSSLGQLGVSAAKLYINLWMGM